MVLGQVSCFLRAVTWARALRTASKTSSRWALRSEVWPAHPVQAASAEDMRPRPHIPAEVPPEWRSPREILLCPCGRPREWRTCSKPHGESGPVGVVPDTVRCPQPTPKMRCTHFPFSGGPASSAAQVPLPSLFRFHCRGGVGRRAKPPSPPGQPSSQEIPWQREPGETLLLNPSLYGGGMEAEGGPGTGPWLFPSRLGAGAAPGLQLGRAVPPAMFGSRGWGNVFKLHVHRHLFVLKVCVVRGSRGGGQAGGSAGTPSLTPSQSLGQPPPWTLL